MAKIVISLGLLVVLLFSVVRPEKLIGVLTSIEASSLLVMAGLVVAIALAAALRWLMLLRPVGYRRSAVEIIRAQMIGQGVNVLIPGGVGGDFLKVFLIAEPPERGLARTLATIGVERILGLAALGAVIAALVLDPGIAGRLPGPLAEYSGTTVLIVGLLGLASCAVVLALDRSLPKGDKPFRRWVDALARMLAAVGDYRRRPATIGFTFLLSVLCHLAAGAAVWVVANDFGALDFSVALLVVMMSFLLTLIPLTVGGLGAREFVFVFMLTRDGFSAEQALALSLCWFVVASTLSVGLAALFTVAPGAKVDWRLLDRVRRPDALKDASSS